MSVLIVDWLGRGGIAQCAETWAQCLDAAGEEVAIATRGGRELSRSGFRIYEGNGRAKLSAHLGVANAVRLAIKDFEPRTVVVQNYLIPAVEELVYRTARSSGTRIVMVVHDHRHHTLLSGTHLGLKNQIRSADAVVCHSRFVAREVLRSTGRKPTIIPLPPPLGVLAARQPYGSVLPELEPGKLRAVHLGVLSRRSGKGTDVVVEIAKRKPVGLEMVFLGSGAPIVEGAITIDGFLDAGVLTQAVSSASLALLPYRFASQSGVIPLCQALGVVPVVTNVGGLSEQVDHGRTGFIMSENSTTDDWLSLLRNLNVKTLDEMTTYMMEDSDRRLAEFGEQSLLVVN